MPVWLDVSIGAIFGLALLAAVFWFVFARPPSRRSDGGLTQHDATNYWYKGVDSGGGDQSV
jgi:hypothetical protein